MLKKSALQIALYVVFPVVFNVIFFLVEGGEHRASVWLSYGFIHFAYVAFLTMPYLTEKSHRGTGVGLSLDAVSFVYFAITFIVSLLLIFANPASCKWVLIIQVFILGAYLFVLLPTMLVNENTVKNQARQEAESQYVKEASSKLKIVLNSVTEPNLRRKVENLYYLVHSSPTHSSESVGTYEHDVLKTIDSLKTSLNMKDYELTKELIEKIEQKANERNDVLKYANDQDG